MSRLRRLRPDTQRMLMKTGSYYLLHISVAACVAYLVTGNLVAALTLSLLEPTVQAFAYFFHEKAWARAGRADADAAAAAREPAALPASAG